ncbi:hypothetical protein IB276_11675 [Ensifer sp. ENS04]|jgi:hypothetical protein|uniref:hypothetical protein n=1 Tax=Ensifer sp. ENS04 TaxID=2769281 RepID=UPI001780EB7A|nr:hypothetical protein [Ensifer sp. ENS04]MBD9540113.1 hypothetical protein [Ensifer sp. ENS04]
MKLSDEDVKQALRWFARQPESDPFFACLESIVDEIGPVDTCALHAHNERRKFAANLIAMAESEKRDGQDSDRTHAPDRPKQLRRGPAKKRRAGPAGRS